MYRIRKALVKSIQIFRYLYPPTTGEVRQKIGNKKILKRKVDDKDDIGEKIELKTTIQFIEPYRGGIGGKIIYEFYAKHNIPDRNDDYTTFKEDFTFLIFQDLEILIIHGPQSRRHKIRQLISNLFNEDNLNSYVHPISINKIKMKNLIQKIKRQGPMVGRSYKNNIKRVDWDFPEESDHNAAESVIISMHPEHCASDYPTFSESYADCALWDANMRIYKCNGILIEEEFEKDPILDLNADASFSFSYDVSPQQWNIFVIETCKDAIKP